MANALALKAPRLLILPHQNLAQATADKLGKIQAQIAPLRNEEAALKQLLRDSGETVVEGDVYRVTITPAKAATKIDWKALAEHYLPADVIAGAVPTFTTVGEPGESRITVKSRIGV
jgi:hypothetical protein